VAGPGRLRRVLHDLVESAIRNVGGGLGRRIRYRWYRRRFRACGRNVLIDTGVLITNPEWMELGDDVWINAHAMLEAGAPTVLESRILKVRENPDFRGERGVLRIGSGVAIGAFNIVQGGGGLVIGDNVTTSAFTAIYSLSHHHRDERNPERVTYANCMASPPDIACIESPIVLEEGVWLGLGVAVFGGTVGRNSFVVTHSVVVDSLPENSYAAGSPARRIRERFGEPARGSRPLAGGPLETSPRP
jgi:acetyltransferase-like isoleucine patch superfamily enzyme